MPDLGAEFHRQAAEALVVAQIGELVRTEAAPTSQTRRQLRHTRLELLYELAFLRMFVAWETFLEEVFLRYLCGYVSRHGHAAPATGLTLCHSLADAQATVLRGRDYILWHSPVKVADRAQRVMVGCPVETVLRSNTARLESFAAIRHRIVHAQQDARRNFDTATMNIAGKRYRGARPGAFLRDRDFNTSVQVRWLDTLGQELQNLAAQIA
jgi:hypothetical protein